MMKRIHLNLHQSHVASEEDKQKIKHQTLLNEFLELQKVSVSSKRKLQTAKERRDRVLAEVRFLRQRYKYLLRYRASREANERSSSRGSYLANSAEERKDDNAHRTDNDVVVFSNSYSKDGKEVEEKVAAESRFVEKQNYLIDEKRVAKRKSWHDEITL